MFAPPTVPAVATTTEFTRMTVPGMATAVVPFIVAVNVSGA